MVEVEVREKTVQWVEGRRNIVVPFVKEISQQEFHDFLVFVNRSERFLCPFCGARRGFGRGRGVRYGDWSFVYGCIACGTFVQDAQTLTDTKFYGTEKVKPIVFPVSNRRKIGSQVVDECTLTVFNQQEVEGLLPFLLFPQFVTYSSVGKELVNFLARWCGFTGVGNITQRQEGLRPLRLEVVEIFMLGGGWYGVVSKNRSVRVISKISQLPGFFKPEHLFVFDEFFRQFDPSRMDGNLDETVQAILGELKSLSRLLQTQTVFDPQRFANCVGEILKGFGVKKIERFVK